jgi:hypothetical protein
LVIHQQPPRIIARIDNSQRAGRPPPKPRIQLRGRL